MQLHRLHRLKAGPDPKPPENNPKNKKMQQPIEKQKITKTKI